MRMNTYLCLLSIAACSALVPVTMAVAQENPARADSQVHFSLQAFEIESSDLFMSWNLGTWSPGMMDLDHLGSIEDGSAGSLADNDLVVHTLSEMHHLVALATSWTRQSDVVAPTFFVQNRLANLESRRTLEHLEPELKGQNRVYCVGLRVNF